jgi:hypothetical protein
VLTAIASELERDEAERRRGAQEQDGAGDRGSHGVLDAARADDAAADGIAASLANGGAAGPGDMAAALDDGAAAMDDGVMGLGDGAAALDDGAVGLPGGAVGLGDIGPAAGYGVSPANGSGADSGNGNGAPPDKGSSTGWDHLTDRGSGYGVSASPVDASAWDRDALWDRDASWGRDASPWDQDSPLDRNALWPGSPAQQVGSPDGEAAGRGQAAADEATAQQPAGTAALEEAADAEDGTEGLDEAAPQPGVPLPRRAPGTHGAPPPPTELRREYLPSSLLGRRLDPEAHTEPLPRIPAAGPGRGPGGPAATGSGQSAPSIFSPASRLTTQPAERGPAGQPAVPGPEALGSAGAGPSSAASPGVPGAPAESVPPQAHSAEAVPPDKAPSRPAASTSALASAPTMPVGSAALAATPAPMMPAGSAALAAASAPTMPAGSAALAAAAGSAPTAKTAEPAADLAPPAELLAPSAGPATPPAPPGTPPAPPAGRAAPSPVTSPPPLPAPSTPARPRPPAASLPAPSGYGWTADQGTPRPRAGRGAGPAVPLPAALPAAKRTRGSGRSYRIAGVILAVVALLVAGMIALMLSGGNTPRHGTGLGPPSGGAGALVRKQAAAWVAGQVSRAAIVACDSAMCQALTAQGVPVHRLYRLGPQTTSPLRSQVIVATATVRAHTPN